MSSFSLWLIAGLLTAIFFILFWEWLDGRKEDKDKSSKVDSGVEASEVWKSPLFRRMLQDNMEALFQSEIQTLAKAYAEEKRTAQYLQELVDKGDKINLTELTSSTQKAAFALVLKRANDAVTLAEISLSDVQQKIVDAQKRLDDNLARNYSELIPDNKKALKEFTTQETICQKRLEEARKNLANLTTSQS